MLWSIDNCQIKVSADQYHVTISGRVNANPGFKLTRMFFSAYVLYSMRLFKPKRGGQTIQKTSPPRYKVQIKILMYPWVA